MTRHRKALSLTLALALVLSLSLTSAFAASEPYYLTHEEALEYIDLQINLDVNTNTYIDDADATEYYDPYWDQTRSYTGYYAFERDTSITVTHLADNPAGDDAYIQIVLIPYRLQEDGSYVSALEEATFYEMWADGDPYTDTDYIYYCTDGNFHPLSEFADNSENAMQYGYGFVDYRNALLAPGDSATFTIPFDRFGDDLMYEMQAIMNYPDGPDSTHNSFRLVRILLDEAAVAEKRAEVAAEEPPAEETPAEPTEDVVVPSNQALSVNGEAVTGAQVYNINGSNYFKLRDVAAMLSGTGSQFALEYDAAARQIVLTTGEAYTPDGSELTAGEDQSATAVRSSQSLTIDGEAASLQAFNIGGNNYFMLRDLGEALGFEVDYDAATRTMIINSK